MDLWDCRAWWERRSVVRQAKPVLSGLWLAQQAASHLQEFPVRHQANQLAAQLATEGRRTQREQSHEGQRRGVHQLDR